MKVVTETSHRTFRPYPAYKPSDIDWLGDMPLNWDAKRLRYVGMLNPPKRKTRKLDRQLPVSFVPMEAVGEYGGIDRGTIKLLEDCLEKYTYFKDGDVVVAKITPCFENGKGALAENLENGIGFGTTELHVIRANPEIDKRFLLYLTFSDHFRRIGASSMFGAGGQKRISDDFIRDFRTPLPSLAEQQGIANFLDQETRKIDALVEKNERLIELLQEKRAALITRAVTKGLDPTVSMKDSGIDWLGEIPVHWHVSRLKYLAELNPETLDENTDPELEIAYVDIGNVDNLGRILNRETLKFSFAPSRARRIVRDGDVIVSTDRTYLRAISSIKNPEPKLIVSTGFAVVRPNRGITPKYASYALRATYFVDRIVANSKGVSFPAITETEMATFELAMPNTDEQNTVAEFLELETNKIDALVQIVCEVIVRLKERRIGLISAAVTGKIDVRAEVV